MLVLWVLSKKNTAISSISDTIPTNIVHITLDYSTFLYTCVKCFITYPWWPYFNTHFAAMQLQCPLHTRVSDDYRLIHQTLPSFPTLFLSPSVHRMIIEYLIWSNRNSHLCLIPLSQFVQSQFNSFYLNLHLYLHCCHIYHIIDLLWVYTIYITKTQMGVSIGWCHPIV